MDQAREAAVISHARRARPALEKELAQLAAEQQRCRKEGKRVLRAVGSSEARSDMTTIAPGQAPQAQPPA